MNMHPDLIKLGRLRPGIHFFTLKEIEQGFCFNPHRKKIFKKALKAIKNLALSGVEDIFIGGSFVEVKEFPNDVDICWRYNSSVNLEKIDPLFLDLPKSRQKIKEKYRADVLANDLVGTRNLKSFLEMFLADRNDEPRGVIQVQIE